MPQTTSLPRLLGFGLLGSALFSSSFVLYELMSVQGGYWFWSASLRCLFMWLLLSVIIWFNNRGKITTLKALFHLFFCHRIFWCLTGSIGLGTYGWLAFGADFAPAWVITSTYLFTVVASLLVLYFFGQRFSIKVMAYALVVFLGIVLANLGEGLSHNNLTNTKSLGNMLLFGALPALIAAFCFPIGNQLIWQATQKHPTHKNAHKNPMGKLPQVDSTLLNNPLHKVWLLTLGSLPT